jgi:hypothetical protein
MLPDQLRLALLQRHRIRKARAPEVVAAWAVEGVTVSVLPDVRHDAVVEQLRGSATRARLVGSLQGIVAELGQTGDMAVIIGWDIDNEPALLIRSDALARSGASLRTIYPDGFVATNQPVTRALIVDFEETGFQADDVRLAESGYGS